MVNYKISRTVKATNLYKCKPESASLEFYKPSLTRTAQKISESDLVLKVKYKFHLFIFVLKVYCLKLVTFLFSTSNEFDKESPTTSKSPSSNLKTFYFMKLFCKMGVTTTTPKTGKACQTDHTESCHITVLNIGTYKKPHPDFTLQTPPLESKYKDNILLSFSCPYEIFPIHQTKDRWSLVHSAIPIFHWLGQ